MYSENCNYFVTNKSGCSKRIKVSISKGSDKVSILLNFYFAQFHCQTDCEFENCEIFVATFTSSFTSYLVLNKV